MDKQELYEKLEEHFDSHRPYIDDFSNQREFFAALKEWQTRKDYIKCEMMNGRHTGRENLDVPGEVKADYVKKEINLAKD